MNQRTLARALAREFFLTQTETAALLHSLTTRLTRALTTGERVHLINFGSFHPVRRAAKKVRHPKTGKIMPIPARMTVAFRAAPSLEETLDNK
mgnify:CR=1 FL=1